MVDMLTTYADIDELTLDVAADQRQWQLENLERKTRQLIELVRAEHEKGEPIQKLAKRAKVTRATIYAWLNY